MKVCFLFVLPPPPAERPWAFFTVASAREVITGLSLPAPGALCTALGYGQRKSGPRFRPQCKQAVKVCVAQLMCVCVCVSILSTVISSERSKA